MSDLPNWAERDNPAPRGRTAAKAAEIQAATEAVNATSRAFVYDGTLTPRDRAKRDDAFRDALRHLRELNGGAAIHLFTRNGSHHS